MHSIIAIYEQICYNSFMIIAFCGHSKLEYNEKTEKKLLSVLIDLAKTNPLVLYCGGYGKFDLLAKQCGKRLKKLFPETKVIFVTPYISEVYLKNKYAGEYDEVLYPEIENVPKKYAIVKRNQYMVRQSDFVIAYVTLKFGGAYEMLNYANKLGKKYINLAEQ